MKEDEKAKTTDGIIFVLKEGKWEKIRSVAEESLSFLSSISQLSGTEASVTLHFYQNST